MENYAVQLKQITKIFGTVVANDKVDLNVKKGSVHALLGENGSGKSTLMKVLFGLHKKDGGAIILNGNEIKIHSPLQAIQNGIGMIQQEFMLLPNLTVRENIIASIWNKNPKTKKKDILKDNSYILRRLKLLNQLDIPVRELSMGEQQKVEIAKTLYQGAEILILDEPTSVLTPQEGLQLFEILGELNKEGKTIILITHKLDEVLNYCDQVTVLRAGKQVASLNTDNLDRYMLAELMVGRKILFELNEKKTVPGSVSVKIENINLWNKKGERKLKNVSLSVRKGEILGIAGIDGNGQDELANVLAGVIVPNGGIYELEGNVIERYNPREFMEKGVSYIPAKRNNLGAVNDISIERNFILKNYYEKEFSRVGVLNEKAIEDHAKQLIQEYGIKAEDEKRAAGTLSGGNLQKVILARELSKNPKFLICSQPTRGLDIGAVEAVQNMLIDSRNKGISIILISTELDEILSLSDRVAIIHDGQIIDVLKNDKNLDIGLVGLMMAGGENPNQFVVGGDTI